MKNERKNVAGIRVLKARDTQNMTQDQLSAQLARVGITIDRPGVSKIENGSRRIYDYELIAIAKILEVSTEWLLGEK